MCGNEGVYGPHRVVARDYPLPQIIQESKKILVLFTPQILFLLTKRTAHMELVKGVVGVEENFSHKIVGQVLLERFDLGIAARVALKIANGYLQFVKQGGRSFQLMLADL